MKKAQDKTPRKSVQVSVVTMERLKAAIAAASPYKPKIQDVVERGIELAIEEMATRKK